jgi:TorA maturation chaperone TorD
MALPDTNAMTDLAEEDILRADLYDLLSALLARPPSKDLIGQIADLNGDTGDLGQGINALSRLARQMTPRTVEDEFNTLFIGLTRGELLPYASYYMTGFLNEKPLALLRNTMAQHAIERAPNVYEPEDNIASLCEMMAGLIRGRFGDPADLSAQKDFFAAHISPWAEHFFTDLEGAKSSVFYAPLGAIGRAFIAIEREAFRMGA